MEYGVHAAHKGANFNLYTGVVWNSIPTSVGVVWHHGEEAGHAPGTLWLTLWLTLCVYGSLYGTLTRALWIGGGEPVTLTWSDLTSVWEVSMAPSVAPPVAPSMAPSVAHALDPRFG